MRCCCGRCRIPRWPLAGGLRPIAVSGWHLAKLNCAGRAEAVAAEANAADAEEGDVADEGESRPKAKPDNSEAAHRFAATFAAIAMLVSGVGLTLTGDESGKIMTEVQLMKMAAAEALYETEGGDGHGALFSILTIGRWTVPVRCSRSLSRTCSRSATGTFDGRVEGINPLKEAYGAAGQLVDPDNTLQQAYAEHMRAWGVET
ncbi:MAG: cytochrome ubiquinol oxidase subunit I [Micropruina sp.]